MLCKLSFVLILFILLIAVTPNGAGTTEIYSWTDENGVRHFSDSPVNLINKNNISVQNGRDSAPSHEEPSKTLVNRSLHMKSDNIKTDAIPKNKNVLDYQLKSVFSGLKKALTEENPEKAASFFTLYSRNKYLNIYKKLSDKLPQISSNMKNIEMVYLHDDVAKYRTHKSHVINGKAMDITYYIYFRIDVDGTWRIELM